MTEFKIPLKAFYFQSWSIPDYMRDGIVLYVRHGVIPGDFLTKVFENDLVHACSAADDNNIANLPAYANFLYNHAPLDCWGSKEKVLAWSKARKEAPL